MSVETNLQDRSNNQCELCSAANKLSVYQVPPVESNQTMDNCIMVCETCREQIENPEKVDAKHWLSLSF